MSTRIDWDVTRGDSETLPVTVTIYGSTDITGAEVRLTGRRPDGALVIAKANTAAGGSDAQIRITNAVAGQLEVYLVSTDLPYHLVGEIRALDYDLEVVRADGVRKTVAYGALHMLMDQTR